MTLSNVFLARISWLNLPAALLIALLQRTPVLRVIVAGRDMVAASPAGQLMRSVFTAAALGALHSRAGATTFRVQQGSTVVIQNGNDGFPTINQSVTGTVGQPLTGVVFTYLQTPAAPARFQVTGSLPTGLSFTPAPVGSSVLSGTPSISGTPQAAGTFTIRVQGFSPLGDTNNVQQPITFVISGAANVGPSISAHPQSQTVSVGTGVTFSVTATGTPSPTYKWRRDLKEIDGATSATLTLPNVQPGDAGAYDVVVTNSAGTATSNVATLLVGVPDANARLTNLSVRTAMSAGQTLIVGVVVNDGSRNVLVRAAGPALASFGLSSAMSDPQLELYNSSASLVLSNDDWAAALAPTFSTVGAFPFANGSRDAAFVQSINAAYSIQARGTGAGVVLVEAYDTTGSPTARLVNVSARNRVGTGDEILIAGFNISGTGSKRLLIRAVGAKLAAFGVPGVLADAKLEIYDAAGVKRTENDNWDASLSALFATVGAFALDVGSRDAALVALLPPGAYTAQVRGATGGTGEALIEIYEVP